MLGVCPNYRLPLRTEFRATRTLFGSERPSSASTLTSFLSTDIQILHAMPRNNQGAFPATDIPLGPTPGMEFQPLESEAEVITATNSTMAARHRHVTAEGEYSCPETETGANKETVGRLRGGEGGEYYFACAVPCCLVM
jgi:hypothetical protein